MVKWFIWAEEATNWATNDKELMELLLFHLFIALLSKTGDEQKTRCQRWHRVTSIVFFCSVIVITGCRWTTTTTPTYTDYEWNSDGTKSFIAKWNNSNWLFGLFSSKIIAGRLFCAVSPLRRQSTSFVVWHRMELVVVSWLARRVEEWLKYVPGHSVLSE